MTLCFYQDNDSGFIKEQINISNTNQKIYKDFQKINFSSLKTRHEKQDNEKKDKSINPPYKKCPTISFVKCVIELLKYGVTISQGNWQEMQLTIDSVMNQMKSYLRKTSFCQKCEKDKDFFEKLKRYIVVFSKMISDQNRVFPRIMLTVAILKSLFRKKLSRTQCILIL